MARRDSWTRRWRALPAPQRRDLFSAAWRLPLAHAVMRLGGLRRAQRLLGRRKSARETSPAAAATWRRRALALKRVGARLPGVHCLSRSLCLWSWMRRAGLDAQLKIGVRGSSRKGVESHSWVTLGEEPIDDTVESVSGFRVVDWH
ncbi:lasso peptide biosynthesis B2 protein [Wenzhouxiangella sp. EGI_FJ10409]|uniref:lasso peptide biosynthesis B2 protein n=1 Tax=Wenzhouxiangella sp. EGI_FJ10409 TaxID=3243767 RepID=UPI0035E36441